MELRSYINSRVHIELLNGFFYIGNCIDATEDDITIIDRKGLRVSVRKEAISSIKGVSQ